MVESALQFGKADFNEKEENIKQNGGQNKQTILLTIKCFKSLCLKAQTKKAAESEGISTAKMSRCVKNKIIINDYYYCT